MEYIQTVLFQIEATRLEQASADGGLLSELDEHREFLKQQPGFRDLRITRSINPEGNVLMMVETRWADDASLVRYETSEPNAAAIVRRHSDLVYRDSLQVLDMEALRTDASWRPLEKASEAQARMTLPLLIPVGVLSFILLVVYGLSRVYLEIRGDGATALAAGIAIGILIVAFYLASNRNVPGWQIAGIFVVTAAVLAGGAIWALTEEDEGRAENVAEEPGGETPDAGEPGGESPGDGGPGGAANVVLMDDNFFAIEEGGEENPTLSVPAGEETTLTLENVGVAPHNMRVAGADGDYNTDDDAESDPALITGGQSGEITFTLDAGDYDYQCDFHPDAMKGTVRAE
jgi:plastocyanin/heme-degrading monooxygenase HmoA